MFCEIKDTRSTGLPFASCTGKKLINIRVELVNQKETDAQKIFGSSDDLKLRSLITLFFSVPDSNPVFKSVLEKFYDGKLDEKTISIVQKDM